MFGGVISGALTLNKTGVGILTLSNASTYSGNTSVSGGTSSVERERLPRANTPVISLAAGTTLSMAGIAPASYTLTGAGPQQTLACSDSAGTANVDVSGKWLELGAGALARFKADGTSGTVGKISVTGDSTLNANAITVDVMTAALGVGSYRLLECFWDVGQQWSVWSAHHYGIGAGVRGDGFSERRDRRGGVCGVAGRQCGDASGVFAARSAKRRATNVLNWTGSGRLQSAPEVTGLYTEHPADARPPSANPVEVRNGTSSFVSRLNHESHREPNCAVELMRRPYLPEPT